MTARENRQLVSFAREIALGAGEILREGFHKSKRITYKGRIDPVTEYDLKAEKFLVSRIQKAYPHHSLLTEEGTSRGEKSTYRWVIDPLDGTVNFAHGFPVYCVSVGVEFESDIVAGAVYYPERDEMFYASRGQGAFMNRTRLKVTSCDRLDRALLATGFAYDIGTARRNNLGLFARMAKKAQGIRRPGSAAIDLCWLAAGRIDGFWELKLHPWDTAAAKLMVEEAGGLVSRINGKPYSIYDKDLLASNRVLHRKMQAVLSSGR